MNAKQRVMARIGGQMSDRIPNLNILMLFAAKEIGVPFSEYVTDYKKLVWGNIACAQKYEIDCVTTMSDSMREPHDMGMKVEYPCDDVPFEKEPLILEPGDLLKIKPVKPGDGRRMTDSLRAIELYKKELGDEYPIIGWVEGCFAEAADIRGVSRFLMDLCDDEQEFVRDLLDLCLEQESMFALAQIEAGADIIGVGDAIASVAGPNLYRDMALEYEIKLLKIIREAGAKTKLHICGNIKPFLADIPASLCDIIDLDWMVPLDEATRLHGGISCLSGNYDPVSVILQGTPEIVDHAVRAAAQSGNHKYISSAGCEIPKDTMEEKLLQVSNTLTLLS
jgi:MtaA/CmuA family methyltransferase